MFDDTPNRTDTVTTLSCYLPQGVALDNPTFEPDTLAKIFVDSVLPNKASSALPTEPALFALPGFAVALNMNRTTLWTVLFLSLKHHHC
jgi:hypothetical protein